MRCVMTAGPKPGRGVRARAGSPRMTGNVRPQSGHRRVRKARNQDMSAAAGDRNQDIRVRKAHNQDILARCAGWNRDTGVLIRACPRAAVPRGARCRYRVRPDPPAHDRAPARIRAESRIPGSVDLRDPASPSSYCNSSRCGIPHWRSARVVRRICGLLFGAH